MGQDQTAILEGHRDHLDGMVGNICRNGSRACHCSEHGRWGHDVSSIAVLDDVDLIPVLRLEPYRFAAEGRLAPPGCCEVMAEDWYRYWLEAMADSGITGLMPVERGSWHVPTREFTDPAVLRRVLEVIFRNLSEAGLSIDLECMPLLGGIALHCRSRGLVEPGCCADLGDVSGWRRAVSYRSPDWHTLSNGHPWVSVRYDAPRLILSAPHEGQTPPAARWSVYPDQLRVAVIAAEAELERFAEQLTSAMPSGYEVDARQLGRKLAGFDQ